MIPHRPLILACLVLILSTSLAHAAPVRRVRIDTTLEIGDDLVQKDVLSTMFRACADLVSRHGITAVMFKIHGGPAFPRTYDMTISFPSSRMWAQGVVFAAPGDTNPLINFAVLPLPFTNEEVDAVRPATRIAIDLVARFGLENFDFKVSSN